MPQPGIVEALWSWALEQDERMADEQYAAERLGVRPSTVRVSRMGLAGRPPKGRPSETPAAHTVHTMTTMTTGGGRPPLCGGGLPPQSSASNDKEAGVITNTERDSNNPGKGVKSRSRSRRARERAELRKFWIDRWFRARGRHRELTQEDEKALDQVLAAEGDLQRALIAARRWINASVECSETVASPVGWLELRDSRAAR